MIQLIDVHLAMMPMISQNSLILHPHRLSYLFTPVICPITLNLPCNPICQITRLPAWFNVHSLLKVIEIKGIKVTNEGVQCRKGSRQMCLKSHVNFRWV